MANYHLPFPRKLFLLEILITMKKLSFFSNLGTSGFGLHFPRCFFLIERSSGDLRIFSSKGDCPEW